MTTKSIEEHIHRAEVLVEALPYIRRFNGHTIVVKLGGSAIEGGDIEPVLQDVVLLRFVGMRPVLVHGGGPAISAWQQRMGIQSRFVNGLRVTDAQTMEIAKMVLTGKVGPELVATIHRLGGNAIGLSGEDGPTLLVRPRAAEGGEDLGFVGEVVQVNPEPIEAILDQGRVPVVASIGLGYDGQAYNVNADAVAAELAVSLRATKLLLLTDVDGVHDSDGSLISELDSTRAKSLIASGVISGGMIPKVMAALRSLDGTRAAHIIDGRVPHTLLLELLTEHGVGTMLTDEPTTDDEPEAA
ncbi:MAG TPA: acetylglutamate kinase [Candidatus Dormibacteraeota bacterium]|jgi:acetylglutamate kinase|nr:acetylglutamate kinase [Candidatus Dormibacteraeota bacterium]